MINNFFPSLSSIVRTRLHVSPPKVIQPEIRFLQISKTKTEITSDCYNIHQRTNFTKKCRQGKSMRIFFPLAMFRSSVRSWIIHYFTEIIVVQLKPLNGITLGQRQTNSNNRLIIISKWVSTNIRHEKVILGSR